VELEAEKKKQVKELTRQRTPAMGSEAQVVPMRNEAASRVIEEAKKKRFAAEKKKKPWVASSFKPSWEKQSELEEPSIGSSGGAWRESTSRRYENDFISVKLHKQRS